MKPFGALFDFVSGIAGWVLVLWGFTAHDPWLFAGGSLLLVLDAIEDIR